MDKFEESYCDLIDIKCRCPEKESRELMDSCTATVELIETRSYWDFKYSWRMKVVEGEGIIGTVFRFKDIFNYYTAEYY